jgi:hypothetical protein
VGLKSSRSHQSIRASAASINCTLFILLQWVKDRWQPEHLDMNQPVGPSGFWTSFPPEWRTIYTNIPLPSDETDFHIRIMYLRRGRATQPLEGSLVSVRLTAGIRFTSLSYVWGEQTPPQTKTIRINGIYTVPITASLHAALLRLRKTASDTALWVDAICINQEDGLEKGAQVSRMAEIYCAADEVVAWLGEASDNSDIAIKYMVDKVAQPDQPMTARADLIRDIQTTIVGSFFSNRTFWVNAKNRFKGSDNLASAIESSLNRLWSRPYWSRIWVVQELASTQVMYHKIRKCTFKCGQNTIPFGVLERFLEITLHRAWYTGADPIVAARRLVTLSRSIIRDHGMQMVPQVLWDSAHLKSSNPLDRIYGIISILPAEYREILPVDYGADLPSLFTKVLEAQIKLEGSLDALCSFSPLTQTSSDPIESFIPDFGARNPTFSPISYSCSLGRKVHASLRLEDSQSRSRTLLARGIRPTSCITGILGTYESSGLEGHQHSASNDGIMCQRLLALHENLLPALSQAYPDEKDQERVFMELVLGPKQHQKAGLEDLTWREIWQRRTCNAGAGGADCPHMLRSSQQLCDHVFDRITDKTIFMTSDGRAGLGPLGMNQADIICILFGCRMFAILRHLYQGHHTLVGPAFIDGVMGGEWAKETAAEADFYIR